MRNRMRTPKPINVSPRPSTVNINGLKFEKGGCFINSYRVAKKNSNTLLVEGVLISVFADGTAKGAAHVWNRTGDIDFDITSEQIWHGHPENHAVEYRYAEILSYPHTNYQDGDKFEFSQDTNVNVDSFNSALDDLNEKDE